MKKIILIAVTGFLVCSCSLLSTSNSPTQQPLVIEEAKSAVEPVVCPSCSPVSTCASLPTAVPTYTATAIPTNTPTSTPLPTFTPLPTSTPTKPNMSYAVQSGSPKYLRNFAHPEKACNWMGVAGQVLDKNGKPLNNIVIVVEGTLSGKGFDSVTLTGNAQVYGPGGFEIKLSDKTVESVGTLKITLFDLAGKQLSEALLFNTYLSCQKNLILVNFVRQG